ncbi:DMT family transporter [Paenibacillus campi]|uniref:DMT family transporter n=1 Tax=Paenibacillus campi TaxID=3106031 RepID=UPI002AFF8C76|nr:DMT family transporter [Paenibacillus sp. SGZ-1009]
MSGVVFAILAGFFVALQGIVNAHTGTVVGTWHAVMINQLGGFVLAGTIWLCRGGGGWRQMVEVKRLYWFGGAFAAIIVFSNITAMHYVGATLTVAALLIAQLCMTFLIDARGWFDTIKQQVGRAQWLGIALMVTGVVLLRFY